MKKTSTFMASLAISGLLLTACSEEGEDDYPTQDITFIVPFGPGGSTDPVGREYAEVLEGILDTNITVVNREGGGSAVGITEVVQSNADGYTLGLCIDSAVALMPNNQDLAYEQEDVELLAGYVTQPANIAVPGDSQFETLEEFVEYAQENPGELQIGNSGAQSQTDLEIQKLANALDTEIDSIDFAGGGEALTSAMAGRTDGVLGRGPTFKSAHDAGDIRVLGTFHEDVYDFLPEVVPFAELGYELEQTPEVIGLCGPTDMPEETLERLQDAAYEAAQDQGFVEFLEQNGYVSEPMTAEEYEDRMEDYAEVYDGLLADMADND